MSRLSGSIAKKYARALFESFAHDQLDAVDRALQEAASLWKTNSDLRTRIESPTVLVSEKISAIQEIGELIAKSAGVDPAGYFSRFMGVLVENGRTSGLSEISEQFTILLRELRKELSVQVVTASEVSDGERRLVGEKIQTGVSSLSSIEWSVDEDLIGGVIIRCGDKTIDGSVRGALEQARTEIVG